MPAVTCGTLDTLHGVAAHLEVWKQSGSDLVSLDAPRVTLGKGADNDIAIGNDRAISRRHAVFERYGQGWSVRDIGSRNGTVVNGERILIERMLRPGDEVHVGNTRLIFRSDDPLASMTETEATQSTPELTRRERDVLLALCRPVLSDTPFTDPATVREIAEGLVVTEAAVKQHLARLYVKFGIAGEGERRRLRLANDAIRRGAVTIADLRA